jgi:hypothetical protein
VRRVHKGAEMGKLAVDTYGRLGVREGDGAPLGE